MKTLVQIGIWMDHHTAHIWDVSSNQTEPAKLQSSFTQEVKEESGNKTEHVMHNKEQNMQTAFYKDLGEVISHATHVLLFGPTDAKTELANMLKADTHFDKVHITVQSSDKMTPNQELALVKDHFTKTVNL